MNKQYEVFQEEQGVTEIVGELATISFYEWNKKVVVTPHNENKRGLTLDLTTQIASRKEEFAKDMFEMLENIMWANDSLKEIGR